METHFLRRAGWRMLLPAILTPRGPASARFVVVGMRRRMNFVSTTTAPGRLIQPFCGFLYVPFT
jgi:hypothetical protein